MITPEALREVPLFSALPPGTLDYVVGAVEDIRLVPGEYFAHEGDERALFVVIGGRAEITKVVNGEELVIGVRTPGMLFGEVPMTLSTKPRSTDELIEEIAVGGWRSGWGEGARGLPVCPALPLGFLLVGTGCGGQIGTVARRGRTAS